MTHTARYEYLLSHPRDYADNPGRRWPLLLFLHGAGERGSDLAQVAKHGPPKLLDPSFSGSHDPAARALAESFIVVSPQCPQFEVWNDERLLALLDELLPRLHADLSRVYLTGMSMGGFGTWSLAVRHPQRFAAVAPVCGGGRTADVQAAEGERRAALLTLGVWAFHGENDCVVPLEESQRMIAAMKAAGATDVRLTVYPGCDHDSWTGTYANPELYAWLLRHRR
jgi:predicted peptidase